MVIHKNRLFFISFVEGASVMAAEISGAKLLAPFFGSSLYVWSSVMAITLAGLASGYFLGGKISKKENKQQNLLYVLMAATVCLFIMPFMRHVFYFTGVHFSLIPAVIISVLALLFPTMLCMGATSPLIISILTQSANESGENSGKIYAVSTVGGIVATFLCGFYLIPNLGVAFTVLCFAIALALVSCLLLIRKNRQPFLIIILPVLCVSIYSFKHLSRSVYTIFQEEGILGKLEIRDEPSRANESVIIRKLLINTIVQTEMNLQSKSSVSEYVHLLKKNSPYFPKGRALVLGLGGGVVSNMLVEQRYNVTSVEFDSRVIDMAKQFFYLDSSVKTVCDDARHYINTCNATYNLILFDIFKAEEQPSHVITIESLIKLKTLMDTNAVILINTHGYITGKKGLGTQCLLATLKQSGFNLKVCASSEDEAYRNLLIIASLKPLSASLHNELYPLLIDNSYINEDDKPIMEKLNVDANQEWRSNYLKNYILNGN